MNPDLLLMVIRQDHERLERDAARGRLAASLNGPGRAWLPRRVLGRLLVGVGQWLLASLPRDTDPPSWGGRGVARAGTRVRPGDAGSVIDSVPPEARTLTSPGRPVRVPSRERSGAPGADRNPCSW